MAPSDSSKEIWSDLKVIGTAQSISQGYFVGAVTNMPTQAVIEGLVVLYVGETDEIYTNGRFYQFGADSVWSEVDVTSEIDGLTPGRVLVSSNSGTLEVSDVTVGDLANIAGSESPLQGQIDTVKNTVSSQGTRLTQAEADIDTLEGKVATAESDISGLKGRMTTAESDIGTLETTVAGKQDAITGGASSIVSSNLVVDSALISDSNGKVAVSPITATELGYLDGATSNIQAQLNSLQSQITAMGGFAVQVVSVLPQTGQANTIYFVPADVGADQNIKDEYMWIGDAWEQIGSTEFSLSITQDTNGITINGTKLQNASTAQPGLMTPTEVQTIDALNTAVEENSNSIEALETQMAGKASTAVATASANGLMSSADKSKLDGIAEGANAYTLPVAGTALGGVKNGGNVVVDGTGNMSVDLSGYATKTELNAKADDSDVTALTGRVSTAEGEIDTLQSQMGTANTNIGNLTTRMGSAESTLSTMGSRVGTLEQGKPSGSYSENKLTIIGVNGVSSDPIDLNPSISTGAGLLIVPSSFIGTANITITDAFDTVVVNNQPITGNISLTNGQYKVSVTQFGSVTKEANVLVLGNTNLVMDFSIFTVGIDGVESMTVGGISIPVGDVTVLKNDADVEVKLTLETLADGLTFTVTKSMNCANDATITADMTDMLIIQNDTTITIKNTAEYEVWACGGGCGGSGGRAGGYVLSNDSYYAGDYGVAGNGGYVISKRINLNANDTIPIIIGAGGAGGAGGASDRLSGKAGTPGGTTTFGTYLSAVGGSSSPYSGGCGSNRTNMDIFGQSVAYGRGASGVDWSSNPVIEKGSKSGIDTSLPFPNAGDGGDGGVEPHGRTTSGSQAIGGVGGKGGNGLSDVYGKGGNGGDGGDRSYGGATGGNGTNGAVAIRRKIA